MPFLHPLGAKSLPHLVPDSPQSRVAAGLLHTPVCDSCNSSAAKGKQQGPKLEQMAQTPEALLLLNLEVKARQPPVGLWGTRQES